MSLASLTWGKMIFKYFFLLFVTNFDSRAMMKPLFVFPISLSIIWHCFLFLSFFFFFSFFLIGYFLYLHFKCFSLSRSPLWEPLSYASSLYKGVPHSPTSILPPWHSPTLRHPTPSCQESLSSHYWFRTGNTEV